MEVGVRDLRNNLSRYLEQVRDGKEITVTDRGRAVARLLPMNGESVFDRLVREGKITPARKPKGPAGKPIKTKGTVSDLLFDEQR